MKYYSTQRSITPGSYPKSPFNDVLQVVNFDTRIYCEEIEREAWGYIEYKYPMHPEDVADYELSVIPSKIREVVFWGMDDFGCRTYRDQDGKIWKYPDPGVMPEERHDRLHAASSNALNGEPGEPMDLDMDYRIKKFKHTEQTAKVYNSMIKEYREISCDNDLERAGLSYDDYHSSDFGLFLDRLRFYGVGSTSSNDVAEWAKRHGCFVTKEGSNWIVRLQEVGNETGN